MLKKINKSALKSALKLSILFNFIKQNNIFEKDYILSMIVPSKKSK